MSANNADVTVFIGATGTGKSSGIKEKVQEFDGKMILVWSALEDTDDYVKFIRGTVFRDLVQFARAVATGSGRYVYWTTAEDRPSMEKEFDKFCFIAFKSNPGNEMGNVLVLAEELSDVTKAGWSPMYWKKISTQGRHKGLKVIGASQRPQLMDKTFLNAATEIRCYRLNTASDAKTMKDLIHVEADEITTLEKFHYFHRYTEAGKTERGIQKKPLSRLKK